MKTGKIFPVSVFLSYCCLEVFAGNHVVSVGHFSRDLITVGMDVTATNNLKTQQSNANVKVTGTIVDNTGEPVIGATVRVKNSKSETNGVISDIDGKFTLTAPKGAVLLISYIGLNTQEVKVTGNGELKITLLPESHTIDQVVVTALGIKRAEKALSYNVQKVSADELTRNKDANFVNSLNGKIAGVSISKSASGVGGATRVIMRGAKSIEGNNNVLYVIDGIPLINFSGGTDSGIMGEGRVSSEPRKVRKEGLRFHSQVLPISVHHC